MIPGVLNLLQRSALRKAATDTGFDLLNNFEGWIEAASTHAPLRAVLTGEQPNIWLGLSMSPVAQALDLQQKPSPPGLPTMACWVELESLQMLHQILGRAWALSRTLPNALEKRFEAMLHELSATEREATVKLRIGQGLFREGLMALWGGKCAITGLDMPELLRASHAKPWADSTDAERLDVFNGLLLAAHWDAAFDAGLVTVDVDGKLRASQALTLGAIRVLAGEGGIPAAAVKLHPQHGPYLEWHRERVFRG